MWLYVCIILNFSFTPASMCKGTILPFAWTGLNGEWKCETLWSLEIFPTRQNSSWNLKKMLSVGEWGWIHLLLNGCWTTVQIGWGHIFCFTSMPYFGKLSIPRLLRSGPPVKKNGVSSLIHPLDCVLTMIFPRKLMVSSVKQLYRSLVLFSTGKILRLGYLSLSSCNRFCFKKLTRLADFTLIFMFTIISHLNPIFKSFLVSSSFLS